MNEQVKKWFKNKTKVTASVILPSPNRFTSVSDVVHGFLDELPVDNNISINGKKYWCTSIEEYSEEKNKLFEEFGNLFLTELQKELDKEILSEIKMAYGKKEK